MPFNPALSQRVAPRRRSAAALRRLLPLRGTAPALRGGALVAALLAVGCATQASPEYGNTGAPAVTATLNLAPPARGFQLETLGTMIEPGDDIRWCEAMRLPGGPEDVYYVDRIESARTPHGEDLIVSAA